MGKIIDLTFCDRYIKARKKDSQSIHELWHWDYHFITLRVNCLFYLLWMMLKTNRVLTIIYILHCTRSFIWGTLFIKKLFFKTLSLFIWPCQVLVGYMGSSILEWVPCPPIGDPPDPGIEPISLKSPSLADKFFTTKPPKKPIFYLLQPNCICSEGRPKTQVKEWSGGVWYLWGWDSEWGGWVMLESQESLTSRVMPLQGHLTPILALGSTKQLVNK